MDLRDQPLRAILQVLTAQLHLAWFYQDGVVWITTAEQAETKTKIAIFDVRDLCKNLSDGQKLREAIESQSMPDSWQARGGKATIEFPRLGIMVVSQTEAVMDQVLSLLEDYRTALKVSKRRISPDADPEVYETKYYRLPTMIAQDLQGLLPELVAKDTWSKPKNEGGLGTIHICSSRSEVIKRGDMDKNTPATLEPYSVLIIYQKRKVHEEIGAVIQKVEVGTAVNQSGGGIGMGGMGGMF